MTMDSGDPESPDLFFLAAIFWVTLVTLGLMPMVIETVRFGREHAERQGFGMSLFIILIMSIPAAAAYAATHAAVNKWRQRTSRGPLAAWWIPLLSCLLTAGLAYTGIEQFLMRVTEITFGPNTEWIFLTLPLVLAAIGTGLCLRLVTLMQRNSAVDAPAADAAPSATEP